jgi:acetyltransferase-like isoleucine patch superfamily enzyme
MPKKAGALARPLPTTLKPLVIGAGTVVGSSCVLYAGTTIGEDNLIADLVSIREGCRLGNAVLVARCTTVNYEATIGNNTRIMDASHITGCMVIEDGVFIGPGVITTNDNGMGRRGHASLEDIKGPIVRRGAAIGANATLLPGVEIGEMAIVGAGAVVTRNVAPRVIVMGVPARVIRDVPPELLVPE